MSADLVDLVDDLLKAHAVAIQLSRFLYRRGEHGKLMTSMELPQGSKLKRWRVPGEPHKGVAAPRWSAVSFDRAELGRDWPTASSGSMSALEGFRRDARRHIRLFTEVVAEALPEWGRYHTPQLEEMSRWVADWPGAPYVLRFPIHGGEAPITSTSQAALHIDRDVQKRLRRWLAQQALCDAPPLRIHFAYDRPVSLTDTHGVLPFPAELDVALRALADLLARAQDDLILTIHGFADAAGDAHYNHLLSLRRAQWVRDRVQHLPFSQIYLRAFGATHASGPGPNAADRYVELLVTASSR